MLSTQKRHPKARAQTTAANHAPYRLRPAGYGGSLQTTRLGRAGPRPLTLSGSVHVVLRSTRAVGAKSMRQPRFAKPIKHLLAKFARRHRVRVLDHANVGNHLHLHVKLSRKSDWPRFIRAFSSAVAMLVNGTSRWQKGPKFWDRRPFTRLVEGLRAHLRVTDYVLVNRLEGLGPSREAARKIVALARAGASVTATATNHPVAPTPKA